MQSATSYSPYCQNGQPDKRKEASYTSLRHIARIRRNGRRWKNTLRKKNYRNAANIAIRSKPRSIPLMVTKLRPSPKPKFPASQCTRQSQSRKNSGSGQNAQVQPIIGLKGWSNQKTESTTCHATIGTMLCMDIDDINNSSQHGMKCILGR